MARQIYSAMGTELPRVWRMARAVLLGGLLQACGFDFGQDAELSHVTIQVPELVDRQSAGFLPGSAQDFTDRKIVALRVRVSGEGMDPILRDVDATTRELELDVPSGAARTFSLMAFGELADTATPIDLWRGATTVDLLTEQVDVAIELNPAQLDPRLMTVTLSDGAGAPPRLVLALADGTVVRPFEEFGGPVEVTEADDFELVEVAVPAATDSDLWGAAQLIALSRDGARHAVMALSGSGAEVSAVLGAGLPEGFASFGGGVDLSLTRAGDPDSSGGSIVFTRDGISVPVAIRAGRATVRWLDEGAWTWTVAVSGDGALSGAVTVSRGSNAPLVVDLPSRVIPDSTPPQTQIDTFPPAAHNDLSSEFTFSSNEFAVFECSFDGASFVACDSPVSYTAGRAGSQNFRVRAIDAAGNVDPTPAAYSWTIDLVPPNVSFSAVPASPNNVTSHSIGFTSSDASAVFDCSLDGANFARCSSPRMVNAVSNGAHTFVVRAVDLAGNVSSEISTDWLLDTVAPTVSLDAAPALIGNDAQPIAEFSSEPGAVFYCRIDGGNPAPCSSGDPITGTPLPDGLHQFNVKALDTAGNFSGYAATSFTIDTTAPTAVALALAPLAADGYINAADVMSNASLVGTPTAFEVATFGYALASVAADCSLAGPYGADVLSGGLTDGAGKVCVQALDAAGNAGYGESATAIVDTVAPGVVISSAPVDPTNSTMSAFTFSSPDGATSFECFIDSVSQGVCSSPYTPTILGDVSHTVDIVGTDAAGNTGSAASHTYTLDTVAPNVTIDTQPTSPSNDATADFMFSADETGATFECNLDAGGYAPCSSPYATTALLDGSHSIEIRAIDPAGNVGSFNFANWDLDTVAPTVSFDIYPADPTSDTNPTFAFSSPDGAVSFECFVDSVSQGPCSSPYQPLVSGEGSHTVEVVATDDAGNTGTAASFSYVLDTIVPVLSTIDRVHAASDFSINATEYGSSTSDVVGNLAASEGVSYDYVVVPIATSCASAGGYGAAVPVPSDFGADGIYKVCVRLTDLVGLVGYGESGPIELDTIAPGLGAVALDAGAPYSGDSAVQVYVSASTDAVHLVTASDAGFTSTYYDSVFTSTTIANLPGVGVHSIYAKVADAAGNFSLALSDTIVVDQAAPLGSVGAPAATSNPTVTLTVSALDDFASVGELEMQISGDVVGVPTWEPYGVSPSVTLSGGDGAKTIYVAFRDPVSNASSLASTSVVLDSAGPGITLLDLDGALVDGYLNLAELTAGSGLPVVFDLAFDEGIALVEQSLESAGADCSLALGWVSTVYYDDHVSDGNYQVCLRAMDILGNVSYIPSSSYTLDTVTPSLMGSTLSGAAANGYINLSEQSDSGDLLTALTASEPSTYEFRAEPAASDCSLAAGYSSMVPAAYDATADGSYKVCVKLSDLAGNVGYGESSGFVRDTSAPTATLDSAPVDPTNDTNPDFAFSSPDGGVSFECLVDAVPQGACSSPFVAVISGDGVHSFDVQAVDAAGNYGSYASYGFVLDTAGPTVSFDSYPQDPTSNGSVNFTFSSIDGAVAYECFVDAVPQGACSSPYGTVVAGSGIHSVAVVGIDAASNYGPGVTYAFELDLTAPQTTIDSGAPAISNTSGTTFFFSADEPAAAFECQIDGGGFNLCSSPQPYGGLLDGSHTFEVRAIDMAGNVDASPASQMWTIDTVPPTVAFDSYPMDPTGDATPELTFSSGDGAVTFECYLDAVSQGPCSSPYIPTIGVDGSHSVGVAGTDAAGNTGIVVSYTFTLDTAAPTVSIGSYPQDPTQNPSVDFSFSSPDGAVSFECFMDSVSQGLCSSPVALTVAGEGLHTFEVVPEDAAGNVGVAGSYAFNLDTSAPTISLVSLEGGSPVTNAAMINVLVFSPDGGGWLELADDAGFSSMLFANFITATDVPAGPEGLRTVWARVRDAAGNYSAAASDSIVIDNSGPAGSVSIPGPYVEFANQNLALSASDTNFVSGSLEYMVTGDVVAGGSWLSYVPSPTIVLNAGDGLRTVNVQLRDPLGNLSSIYTTSTTIDNTDPLVAITAPANGAATSVAPLVFGNHADFAGSGVASVWISIFDGTFYWDGGDFVLLSPTYVPASLDNSSQWSYGALPSGNLNDGVYAVDVTAMDWVGNVSSVQSISFDFDESTPTCSQCLDVVGTGNGALLTSTLISLNSTGVTDAHGPVEMRITGDVVDGLANQWIAYSSSSAWNLTAVDGSKSVYIEYRDSLGNATSPYAAVVTVDATPASVTLLNLVSALGNGSLNLAESAAFATAPITSAVSFSEAVTLVEQAIVPDGTPCASVGTWYPGRLVADLAGDGDFRLCHRMMDLAGNVSYDQSTMFTVDLTPPLFTSLDVVMLAADGYLNANDVVSTNYAVGNLAGSGYTSDSYQWASAAADCSTEVSYIGDYPRSNELVSDGSYKGCVRLADAAGNVTFGQSSAVTRDTVAPTISVMELAAGASVTNADPIPVQVVSPDGGYYMQLASDLGFSGLLFDGLTGTENVSRGSDGTQYVYARVRDLAGNFSLPATGFTVVDTQGPTGSIDISPTVTNNSSQLLTISASDPNFGAGQIQMRITGDVLGGGTWEPYSASVLYDLSGIDGFKTVYVEFQDALGNVSGLYSDSVELDTILPGVDSHALATELGSGYLNAANQSSSNPVINWYTASEPTASAEYSVTDVGTACFLASYQASIPVLNSISPDGDYHVCVHLFDLAGNEDFVELDVFTRDTSAPTISSVLINAGAPATNNTSLVVQVAVTGADSLELSENVAMSAIVYSGSVTTNANVVVSAGDGIKDVFARAADLAMNYSTIVSDDINLDTFAPALTSLSLSAELQDGVYSYLNNLANPSGPAVTDAAFDGPVTLVEFAPAWLGDACSLQSGWTGALSNSAFVSYQGAAKLCVRMVDLASNVGYGESGLIEVDTVQPTLSTVTINGGAAYATSHVVSVSAAGSGATTMRIATDAAMTSLLYDGAYNDPQTVNVGFGESDVTLYVRLRDNVGNTNGVSISDSIYRDTVPAFVTIASPANGVYVQAMPDPVSGSANDAGSGVSSVTVSYFNQSSGWYWNGSAYASGSAVEFPAAGLGSWSRSGTVPLVDGQQFHVRARVMDMAGNETLYGHTVTADQSGPVVSITAPTFAAQISMPPVIAGTSFDAWTSTQDVTVSVFNGTFYWDGAGFTSLSAMGFAVAGTDAWSYAGLTTQALADGTYVVDIVATDILGNQGFASTNFVLDQSGPTCGTCAAVSYAPVWGSYPYASTYVVDLTSSAVVDPHGPIQMMITGDLTDGIAGNWIGYTSSYPINLMLYEGVHSIYVSYRDVMGNLSGPYQVDVTLDATPPTVDSVVLAGGAGEVTVTTTTLLVLASNGPVNYSATGDLQVPLVQTNYTGTPTNVELMPGDGGKTIYVTAFDLANNQSGPVSATVELDTTPPIANGLLLAGGAGSISVTGSTADVIPDPDAVEMIFSGDISAPLGWIPYAATSPVTLSGSTGQQILTSFASLRFTASARDTNGDVILAGQGATSDQIAVVRLRGDGTHDSGFGTGGVTVIANLSGAFPLDVSQVIIDSENRIVLVGNYSDGGTPSLHVTRLFNWGGFDNGFGSGGTAVFNDGSDMRGATILDMGGFYVVGGSNSWSGNEDAFLIFVASFDGSLRSDIGDFGKQQIHGGRPGDQRVLSLTHVQGGAQNYYVGIRDGEGASIVRMSYPSSFDNSFASGELTLPALGITGRLAVIGNKDEASVFVAYGSAGLLEIRKYDPNGVLDTGWGASGVRSYATGGDTRLGSALLTEGFMSSSVRAVASVDGGNSLVVLSAQSISGAEDLGFGPGGARVTSWIGGDLLTEPSLTVDPNGRTTLVATRAGSSGGLIRLTSSGNRDHTFGNSGNGLKIVSVKLRDIYGRESGFASDSVLIDTLAPTGAITTATQYTDQLTNTVFFLGSDAQPVTSYSLTGDVLGGTGLTAYLGGWQSQPVTFTGGENRKWLGVVFVDEAMNIGGPFGTEIFYDLTPPVAAIDGPLYTSNTNYVFTAIATDTVTEEYDLEMRYAADVSNLNAEPWSPFTGAGSNVFFAAVEGPHMVRLQVRDGMGHMSAEVTQTVILDMTQPVVQIWQPYGMYVSQVADVTGTVLDPGAFPSGVTTVSLAISENMTGNYIDGGTFGTPSPVWYTVPTTSGWSYSGFAGAPFVADRDYTIYATVADLAGNGGSPAMYTFRYDITAPTCGMCLDAEATVGSGSLQAGYTRHVTIDAMSAGVSDNWSSVQVMYSGDITDAFAGTWAPYGGTALLHLTIGDGPKTIMARYRDAAGNMTAWYSDVVTLDTVGPSGASAQLEFGVPATDTFTGVRLDINSPEGLEFDVFGDVDVPLNGNLFTPTSQFLYVNLTSGDGPKTVTVRMYDGAGNYSDVTDSIDLDTQGPTGSITGPSLVFSQFSIPVTIGAGDAHGVAQMRFVGSDVASPTPYNWIAYATNVMVDITTGDGAKAIQVEFKDTLGNTSGTYTHNLTLDTTPPDAPSYVTATIVNANTGELYIEWAPVTGASSYEVHYDLDSGAPYNGTQANQGSSPRFYAGGNTSAVLTGFLPGQEIFIAVKVQVGAQISAFSSEDVTGVAGTMVLYPDFLQAVTGTMQLIATKQGNAAYDMFGVGGAIVGDVDLDGVDDYAWGAPDADHTYSNAGEVRLYSGLTNSPLLVTSANDPLSASFGQRVASWHVDLNLDGRMDYLVSDPSFDSNKGRIFAMSGFPGAVPLWTATGWPGDLMGQALISTDDVNGDGIRDVVASRSGGFYQLSGADGTVIRDVGGPTPDSLAEVPDINGDGIDDFVIGDGFSTPGVYAIRSTDGASFYTITNPSATNFGQSIAVGDFDGDTQVDVAVAAPAYELTGSDRGVVYVYRLSDGVMLQQVQGDQDGDMLGGRLLMRDLDNDGMSEVIATAAGVEQAGTDRGALYVLRGGALHARVHRLLPDTENSASFGSSLFAGDVNHDGHVELFVGASSDVQPSQLGAGRRYQMPALPKVYANGDVVVAYGLSNMGGRAADEVVVRVDGGQWQKYSALGFYGASFPVTSLVHGLRNVEARVVDEFGYPGPVTILSFEVDLSVPQPVTLNSPGDGQLKFNDLTNVGFNEERVAVDQGGKVHIAYREGSDLKYTSNTSGSWVTETVVTSISALDDLEVDPLGKAHVVYRVTTPGNELRYINRVSGSWSGFQTIRNVMVQTPALVLDGAGKAHVAWADGSTAQYAHNATGPWSAPFQIYDQSVLDLDMARRSSGKLYVAVRNASGNIAVIDNEAGWANVIADNTGTAGIGVAVTVDTIGKVYLAYRESPTGKVRYNTNVSGSYNYLTLDDTVVNGNYQDISLDANGKPIVTYACATGCDSFVYAQRFNGSGWRKTKFGGGNPNRAQHALASDNTLHAVLDNGVPGLRYANYRFQYMQPFFGGTVTDPVASGIGNVIKGVEWSLARKGSPDLYWDGAEYASTVTQVHFTSSTGNFNFPMPVTGGDNAGTYEFRIKGVDGGFNRSGTSYNRMFEYLP